MCNLLEIHKHEIKFAVGLRHIPTGLYVCYDGFTSVFKNAIFITTDADGLNVEEILLGVKSMSCKEWLCNFSAEDFQRTSKLV